MPHSPLEIKGGDITLNQNLSMGNGQEIGFSLDGTGSNIAANMYVYKTNASNAADFAFSSWNGSAYGEKFRITSGGNVGIGTIAPIGKLQVHTDGAITLGAFSTYSNTATDHPTLYLLRGEGTAASTAAVQSGDELGKLRFAGQYDTTVGHYTTSSCIGASAPSDLVLFTTPSGSATPVERMRVSNNGNVGIGTTTPGSVLDVRGTDFSFSGNDQTSGAETRLYLTPLARTGTGTQSKLAIISEAINLWGKGKLHLAVNTVSDGTNATKADAKLTVDSTGYVGIGTTSPAFTLDVNGTIRAGSKTKIADRNISIDDGVSVVPNGPNYSSNSWGFSSYYGYNFATNNGATNALSILTNGYVGIGTATPAVPLQVMGDFYFGSQTGVGGRLTAGGNDWYSQGHYESQFGVWVRSSLGTRSTGMDAANGWLAFRVGGNDNLLNINSGGNVGIGTTSPSELMQVGDATENATNRKVLKFGVGGYASPGNFSTNSNGDKIIFYNGADFDGRFGVSSVGDVWLKSLSTSTASQSYGSINLYTGQGAGTPVPVNRLSISGTGNVGIGGTITSASTLAGSSMTIVGGNVGIGTTAPGAKLQIGVVTPPNIGTPWDFYSYNSSYGRIGVDSGNNNAAIELIESGSRKWGINSISGVLHFWDNSGGASRMSLLSNGNVGIGTMTPGDLLHVATASSGSSAYQARYENSTAGGVAGFILRNTSGWDIRFRTNPNSGWFEITDSTSLIQHRWNAKDYLLASNGILGFSSETNFATAQVGARDVGIARNTAGVLEINSGTAGAFRDLQVRSINPASGNVGIGTTGPSYKLDVAGDINTSTCFRIGATTVSGTCTSDERLKENVQDYDAGLSDLLNIRLHTYTFNGLGEMPKTGEVAVGVIAQEVEKTNPELVKTRMVKMRPDDREKTEIKVVDYSKFSYMLINAVKELYQKWFDDHSDLQALKDQVRGLASENENLKSDNTAIKSDNARLKAYLCQKDPGAPICH